MYEVSLYHKAINLNNEGVSCFELGDYEGSIVNFRSALETIKRAVEVVPSCSETDSSGASFEWSSAAPLCQPTDSCASPPTHSFIFRKTLLIYPPDWIGPNLSEESCAIIYNLALAFHCAGREHNSSNHMGRALQFYGLGLSIRQKKRESTKLMGERLLDAAILNNMGQLYQQECINYDIARQCFKQLSCRLSLLTQSGFLDSNDLEGFVMNLMIEPPNLAAAA